MACAIATELRDYLEERTTLWKPLSSSSMSISRASFLDSALNAKTSCPASPPGRDKDSGCRLCDQNKSSLVYRIKRQIEEGGI
jgi:hypothetical protein